MELIRYLLSSFDAAAEAAVFFSLSFHRQTLLFVVRRALLGILESINFVFYLL